MLNKLRAFNKQYCLILPGDTVTVALSGGADSVALLFSLYLLKEEWGFSLEAAHFNHHLREAESDRDAQFAESLCDRFSIPFHFGEAWVTAGEKGLEAAARDARYAFFSTLPGKVATAHTADDNAETVLMRLLRGTGLKGLCAIAPQNRNLIRPMLTVTREEVEDFLREYALPHVEDSSNAGDAFLRNRIRHNILPLLRQENPRIGENLSAMALNLQQDEAYISQQVQAETLGVSQLRQLPAAIRRRYLERFLKQSGVKEPEQAHIMQVESLVFHWNPSVSMDFPGGVVIARRYDALVRQERTETFSPVALCEAATVLPQLGLRIIVEPAIALSQTATTFTVCPQGTLWVRPRRSGDQIALSAGHKSLKKLFIDRKIPATQREKIPLIADEQGILGVYGIGADENRRANSLPAVTIRFESL